MQTSQIQTVHHDSGFSRRLARGLAAGLVLCAGLSTSAAHAQTRTTYRWWNPNGSPVTGPMSNSSNWEDFILPSLSSNAENLLVFQFANESSFEAVNDLADFLSVSGISRAGSITYTARISGAPLRLRTSLHEAKCHVQGGFLTNTVLETPLAGTSGMFTTGNVTLNPSNRSQHTITGGFDIGSGYLRVSEAWHLGAISNTVTLKSPFSGILFYGSMNVVIPINCELSEAILNVKTDEVVTLQQYSGSGARVMKLGSGTLRIYSTVSGNIFSALEGTLELGPGAIDDGEVDLSEQRTLRLLGDSNADCVDSAGLVDMNGFTLELQGGRFSPGINGGIVGEGVIRSTGPTTSRVSFDTDLTEFKGLLESRGGKLVIGQRAVLDSSVALSVPQPEDLIEFTNFTNDPISFRVGTLSGAGNILGSDTTHLTIGVGDGYGLLTGSLTSESLTKIGSGRQDLMGALDISEGAVIISDGELGLSDAAASSLSNVIINANGLFSPLGNASVPTIEGAGTVELNSQTLTVGESDADFILTGALNGNIETSTLRKRGSGTFTLSADTTGFGGFFQINDGAVRFTGGPILPAAASLSISNGALRGFGDLARPYWNQGTITADSSAGVLRLSGQDQWNNGTINAENGGTLELDGVFLEQDFSGSLVQGSLESDETPIRLIGDNPTIVQGGTIETTGTGSLELIGTAITLREVDHSGHLSLRSGVDVTAEDFGIVTGASHIFSIEFEPDSDEDDGAIRGHGTATLGGTLQVTLPNGYEPTAGDVMTVLGGDDTGVWVISESFETIDVPDVSPLLMRVESDSDSLRLVVTCGVDMAEPFGSLDIFDVFAYLDAFNAGDPIADYTADGTLDIFDVFAFLEAFNAGCP